VIQPSFFEHSRLFIKRENQQHLSFNDTIILFLYGCVVSLSRGIPIYGFDSHDRHRK